METENATHLFTNVTEHHKNTCHVQASAVFYLVIYAIVIGVGLMGNALVLYIFHPIKCRRKSYEILIWYLSLFDFLSLLIAIHEIYEKVTCHKRWVFGWFGCKIIFSFYYISINMSVCILLIIALDRYRCIVTPFKKKFTSGFIHCCVCLSIAISFALQWYQFQTTEVHEGRCKVNRKILLYPVSRVTTIMFRDLTFILVFVATAIKIHQSFETRRKRSFTRRKNCLHRNRRIFSMLLVMGGAFAVLILPYDVWDCTMLITSVLSAPHVIKINLPLKHLDTVLSILQMCSCVLNCFIYSKMHRHFKTRMAQLFSKKKKNGFLNVPFPGGVRQNSNSGTQEVDSSSFHSRLSFDKRINSSADNNNVQLQPLCTQLILQGQQ